MSGYRRLRTPSRLASVRLVGATKLSFGASRPLFAYLLNVPSIFVITMLVAYPIGYSMWVSVHRYDLRRPEADTVSKLQSDISLIY
jgi:ABC-type sugar transport system permease subunit